MVFTVIWYEYVSDLLAHRLVDRAAVPNASLKSVHANSVRPSYRPAE
jgi:hypothetical protein